MALGKGLGLDVVAEGAETEEELAILRDLDCSMVQGYLIGRPVSPLMAPIEGERLHHRDAFLDMLGQAAARARRPARLLAETHHAPDHPVALAHPEGRYLKGFLLEVAP